MKQSRRVEWMPQNATELCACISVLAMQGKLSPADEQHVAGWIAFRNSAAPSEETTNG